MTAPPADIVVDRVVKRFGNALAVDELSFRVEAGESIAIVGATGCGKSTALRIIMGALPLDSGSVRLAGIDPYHEHTRLRGRLAVAFQTDRLLPWCRAWENVAIGLQIMGVAPRTREGIARKWLERVMMGAAAEKYPHELSGGMRQRVSLARAFAVEPGVLLLDETFSQLDEVTSRELRRDFSTLVRSVGTTAVLVTHRIEEALEAADRVLVLGRPARVLLEVPVTQLDKREPERMAKLRADISAAMTLSAAA
jgi:NitT/TauT family transport system ATP-binding protein